MKIRCEQTTIELERRKRIRLQEEILSMLKTINEGTKGRAHEYYPVATAFAHLSV